ncbi:SWIB/MDM2 domain-containing protein [Aphelenchoides besseyi]|nr:SWIB/MDM2 domain-containing protein [Aphelenchoides besseyi]KAI6235505.1 SWIB/MDM2 domain-containing protein [Aphelenchoides besseyi]
MSLPVERETLAKDILELVRNADLKVMTSKSIRGQLETKYNVPFRDFRKEIDEIIRASIVQIRSTESASTTKQPQPTNGNLKTPSTNNNEDPDSDVSSPRMDDVAAFGDMADDNDVYSAVKRRRAAQRPVQRKPPAKRAKKETSGKKNTAFTRICVLSDELSTILDRRYMRRSDVVKEMWAYFKKNDLLDPKDRRFVIPDERMRAVLGGRRIQAFGMMKNLKNHIKDVELLDEDTRRTAIREIEQLEDSGFNFDSTLLPTSSKSAKPKTESPTKPVAKNPVVKKTVEKTPESQESEAKTDSPPASEPRAKLVLRISKNKERVVSVTVNDEAERAQSSGQSSNNNAKVKAQSSTSSSASSSNASVADMEDPPHLDPEINNAEPASAESSSSSDSSDSSDSSSDSSDSSPEDSKAPPSKNGNRGTATNDLQLSESDSDED